MSPSMPSSDPIRKRFPRVSGDEPRPEPWEYAREQFSPRERG